MTQSPQAWQEKKIPVYDDGPNHTAKISADFIMKKEVIKSMTCPNVSPDLNQTKELCVVLKWQ